MVLFNLLRYFCPNLNWLPTAISTQIVLALIHSNREQAEQFESHLLIKYIKWMTRRFILELCNSLPPSAYCRGVFLLNIRDATTHQILLWLIRIPPLENTRGADGRSSSLTPSHPWGHGWQQQWQRTQHVHIMWQHRIRISLYPFSPEQTTVYPFIRSPEEPKLWSCFISWA